MCPLDPRGYLLFNKEGSQHQTSLVEEQKGQGCQVQVDSDRIEDPQIGAVLQKNPASS